MPESRPLPLAGLGEAPRQAPPQPPRAAPSTGALLPGLRWRLNRLRCMGAAEIAHRVGQALGIRLESWFPTRAAPAPDLAAPAIPWLPQPGALADLDPAPYLAAADRLVAGRFDVFALENTNLGTPPAWNRDPKTGIDAPLTFGKRLDYRNPKLVGDIKYLWEPNRHQHLVTLAQAWRLSGQPRYAETLASHLQSWCAACPPGLGPNWASALEPGLRLISWSLAWQLLGGASSPVFDGEAGARLRQDWLAAVYHQAEFIAGFFSLYSSANNHLIGEAAGLYIAALTWPHWPRARHWESTARTILEREALLQNAPDGVNREQAVAYQVFELDLLLLPLLAARAQGKDFPPAYASRLEHMLDFLASIMDAGGHLPQFGDADDGAVARLDPRPEASAARSLLATGALLFWRGDFKAKAGPLDDKSRWLLGPEAPARYAALPPPARSLPVRRAFPEGGYYILGDHFETPEEIRLVADGGPLGYQAIAAHGHADALSFTLSLGGDEFLVDPGTYAYHTEGEWRAYFRGTAAHNTLRVDGRDQSEQGGNFLWLAKARAAGRLERLGGDVDIFEGWQDGYRRLDDPVMHHRRIVLEHRTRRIVIVDQLEMASEHQVELFFHFAETCQVEVTADGCIARQGSRSLQLRLPELGSARLDLFTGSTNPVAGWISRRFDRKTPCSTLRWQGRLTGTTLLRTEMLVR